MVTHVAAHPHKFSAENIADVVRWLGLGWQEGRVTLCWGEALVGLAWSVVFSAALGLMPLDGVLSLSRAGACRLRLAWRPRFALSCQPSQPTHPCNPRQVYAFSRCGFCHPDLITVVETAAGTLLKEAAADRGYVSALACYAVLILLLLLVPPALAGPAWQLAARRGALLDQCAGQASSPAHCALLSLNLNLARRPLPTSSTPTRASAAPLPTSLTNWWHGWVQGRVQGGWGRGWPGAGVARRPSASRRSAGTLRASPARVRSSAAHPWPTPPHLMRVQAAEDPASFDPSCLAKVTTAVIKLG